MEDNISKIKEKIDVVDLVGSYVKLTKAGINYKAPCPFHNEKSGSFFVSPERQIWHCFGCGLGGDIFGFVKQIEGVEFPEALRILAARAGIQLSSFRVDPALQDAKTKLLEITDLAAKFFGKQLHESTTGQKALAYLRDRGLTDESINKFRLGYAPESWDGLGNFLARTYDLKEIFDAGLLVKKEQGGYYDRFRSRIMFPIFDINNQIVGFTGRVFGENKDESTAKYVNTPQTAIYDKSRVLYGMNFAKLDIRKKDRVLVVEGNMDVIMSHQAGASHAIASSGTALTEGHLSILKRYSTNLDLCFDADSAGEHATERGVDLALARGFNVGIVTTPEKDPADYVKKYGNADFVNSSKPFMEFFYDKFRTSLDLASALGKKTFSQKLLPFVAAMTNNIEKAHWVAEIANALKLKEDVVQAELALIKPRVANEVKPSATLVAQIQEQKMDVLEESLLSLLLKKPSLKEKLTEAELAYMPTPTPLQAQFASLKAEEYWRDVPDATLDEELEKLLKHLKRRTIGAQLESLEYDIKQAERDKDTTRLATLVAEFAQLSSKL